MKILVTGGAGFIASHIVDAYIADNHQVIVVDNLSSGREDFINPKAKFYQTDINNKKEIEKIFKGEKPAVLNHHDAQISVSTSVKDPINDARVNILGLLTLLEAAKKSQVKKIIFASSGGAIYGEAKTIPTPESYTPIQPLSPYGVSKLVSEYYLHFYYLTYHFPYISLRYANVYGPRQNPHGEAGVVAIFTSRLLQGKSPVINGSGKQTRDYIYVSDVVEANLKALKFKDSGVFNIGTGKETNVTEIYQRIKKALSININASYGPERSGEQKRSCLETHFAKEVLSWETKVNLTEGLKKTGEYFKEYVS